MSPFAFEFVNYYGLIWVLLHSLHFTLEKKNYSFNDIYII